MNMRDDDRWSRKIFCLSISLWITDGLAGLWGGGSRGTRFHHSYKIFVVMQCSVQQNHQSTQIVIKMPLKTPLFHRSFSAVHPSIANYSQDQRWYFYSPAHRPFARSAAAADDRSLTDRRHQRPTRRRRRRAILGQGNYTVEIISDYGRHNVFIYYKNGGGGGTRRWWFFNCPRTRSLEMVTLL